MTNAPEKGMLDHLRDLRATRDEIAHQDWRALDIVLRAFREEGCRTWDRSVDTQLIATVLATRRGTRHVGESTRTAVLEWLDKEIFELSKQAKDEAEAVIQLLENER